MADYFWANYFWANYFWTSYFLADCFWANYFWANYFWTSYFLAEATLGSLWEGRSTKPGGGGGDQLSLGEATTEHWEATGKPPCGITQEAHPAMA